MRNFWLSEMYFDELDNCYKPKGWDLVEGRGFASIRHDTGDYANKVGNKVILETNVSSGIEQELRDLGLTELNRDFLNLRKASVLKKVALKDRKIFELLK